MIQFLKILATKFGLLGVLFIILLLLPMGWPIIIVIMVISALVAFMKHD